MRAAMAVLGLVVCLTALGCAQIEEFMNPRPRRAETRVTPDLRSIPRPDPANVKTVTVYRIENKTSFIDGLSITNGMTDQLITALVATKHFRVAERAVLNDLMTERSLQQSGEATSEVGETKLAGAELIFAGSVTELDEGNSGEVGYRGSRGGIGIGMASASVGLDMRVIDAATGLVIDSIPVRKTVRETGVRARVRGLYGGTKVSAKMDQAIRETIEEAVYQLVTNYGAAASSPTAP